MKAQVLKRLDELGAKLATLNRLRGKESNLYTKAEYKRQARRIESLGDRIVFNYNVYAKKVGTPDDQRKALEFIRTEIN